MGASSRVGTLLEEFVPATQVNSVAEAVKRMFDKHGDRKNRNRARICFLIKDIGIEAFDRYYREELEQIRSTANAAIQSMEDKTPQRTTTEVSQGAGFSDWLVENATQQRQQNYNTVEIAPPLGILQSAQLRQLADIVERFGEGVLRATHWQNAVLRWVPTEQLAALHLKLAAIGLGSGEPAILRNLVTSREHQPAARGSASLADWLPRFEAHC